MPRLHLDNLFSLWIVIILHANELGAQRVVIFEPAAMTDAAQAHPKLRELVESVARDQQYDSPTVTIQLISSGGGSYTSKLFQVNVSSPGKPDLPLFAKMAVISEDIRKKFPAGRLYQIECYFYKKLLKFYERIQNDHSVPIEHRLRPPRFYGCNENVMEETVVLENLSTQGYALYDRHKSVDWEYASTTVEELAKLHALSFAYRAESPEEFAKSVEELNFNIMTGDKAKGKDEGLVRALENAIKMAKDEYKERLSKHVAQLSQSRAHYYKPIRHTVLRHGDYRVSNLLHRRDENGKLHIVVVDYQTIQSNNAALDLVYFIFTSTDQQFRAKHYDQLVQHYYQQLALALRRLDLDPAEVYPREDFDAELRAALPYGIFLGLFILQIVTLDEKDAPSLDTNYEEFNLRPSEEYAGRLNGILSDLERWGFF